MIRAATAKDAKYLAEIYNYYVTKTVVTFDEIPLTTPEMRDLILDTAEHGCPWLVAEKEGVIIGYALATKWKERSAYRHTVEVSAYLAQDYKLKGWGSRLYQALFEELKKMSVHVVIAGIALPNNTSIALHEKFGMEKVGYFREVGFKLNRWVDMGYWQLRFPSEDNESLG